MLWQLMNQEKNIYKKFFAEITGKNSASGTFRFGREPEKGSKKIEVDTIAISELFQNISDEEVIIVKIDIEGGEEELLENNIEWIKRCHYLTIEVHDKFDPIMLDSSRNLIKIIHENNFAVVPSKRCFAFI